MTFKGLVGSILIGLVGVLLLFIVLLEQGKIAHYFVQQNFNKFKKVAHHKGIVSLKVGLVEGGLFSGIHISDIHIRWKTEFNQYEFKAKDFKTTLTWPEVWLYRLGMLSPQFNLELGDPDLKIRPLSRGYEWAKTPQLTALQWEDGTLRAKRFFQVSNRLEIPSINIINGTFSWGHKEDPLIDVKSVNADYNAYFHPKETYSVWEKINFYLENGEKRKRVKDRDYLSITCLFRGEPVSLKYERKLTQKNHVLTYRGPNDKKPLLIQFSENKGHFPLHINLWGMALIESIVSYQNLLNHNIQGLLHKGQLLPQDIPTQRLPFPLSLFERLKNLYISEWKKTQFSYSSVEAIPTLSAQFMIGTKTLHVDVGLPNWQLIQYRVYIIGHGGWSGSYNMWKDTFDSRITVEALDAKDLSILSDEETNIDMKVPFAGEAKLYGPRNNLSLDGNVTVGKGHYEDFDFIEGNFTFKGTGRHIYIDKTSRMDQQDGKVIFDGFIDLKEKYIFRNVNYTPINSVQSQRWTLKNKEEQAPTIDRKLIKNIDIEFKGNEETGEQQQQPEVKLKIQKTIKF